MYEKLAGILAKEEQESNMQNTMRPRDLPININVGFKLANSVYQFLTGKSNSLPSYDYVNEYIRYEHEKQMKNAIFAQQLNFFSFIVSVGCGMSIVYVEKGNEKEIVIDYETPMRPRKIRKDTISKDRYEAYTVLEMQNDQSESVEQININQEPLFDEKRVEYLQNYLKNFSLQVDFEFSTKPKRI